MEEFVNLPKTKRGQKTLDNIVRAAEELFFEKGYHATSIIDITNEANIALGTFYIYFKDKYSLYKFLLLSYSHDIRKAIALDIKPSHTRFEAEKIGLKAFLVYIRDHKHVYNIIWESLYIDKTLFIEYYEDFAGRYATGLVKAQEKGEVVDVDTTILSYFLMGVSNFIGLKYVMFDEDKDDNLDEVVEKVMDILEAGMFLNKKSKN
ncbi:MULTISPECIES: TetR/AcrR family transcriptional regulator [Proteiniclasticum]|uniref:DNA-binding transcriptional regulator, AcrR family n=1 Tax=Proteiniclasticum ruminis TaxID=398199 RepID=A0A1G8M9B9_9CLOT|nr:MULTISPECIES: TetR/AcrR family transcriptional regulator [Proteiniclasticum]SDI64437.1 DNA-binding transcriptional regulator, AcrR family [Proteiniclasticum ruminis]SFN65663.1 DNA-binding transcriptional regulator, AcrR family [Proteiniclasticum ruminis]HBW13262.1 TetR/AcrR family transcriptional regulator [Proteiniclasticum sp.]